MGQVTPPQPVKLIVGMIAVAPRWFESAEQAMRALWGPIDIRSETIAFDFTTYYEKEMGPELLRRFVSFERLIDPGELAAIKHASNAIEDDFARQHDAPPSSPRNTSPATAETAGHEDSTPARPINLDPGLVAPGKLVLATTKNYAHRVYIGQGMYAEATLSYRGGRWQQWPYTYPDYASGRYDEFLTAARNRLMQQREQAQLTAIKPQTSGQPSQHNAPKPEEAE